MSDEVTSHILGGVVASLMGQPLIFAFLGLALSAVFFKTYSRNIKGRLGEWALSKILHSRCGKDCAILDDVTLIVADGDTTQIDHIVVTPSCLFVIETKFYKGRIYGKVTDKEWTQKIFKNTYKFQNPFRQNYKHLKVIEALFPDIRLENIHSVVVMLGECEWASKDKPVALFTSGWKAVDYINSKISSQHNVIDVESVVARLQSLRLQRGLRTNQHHVRNLRRK